MIKTHSKALEELSHVFPPEKWAVLKEMHEYFVKLGYSTIPHEIIQSGLGGIEKIAKLQLEGKIYGFHLQNSWEEEQRGYGEGYQLFLRHGNTLKDYFREYGAINPDNILNNLFKQGYREIYTGEIPFEGFLELKAESTNENDGHVIRYEPLKDYQIESFERDGIKVITLDSLI